MSFYHRIPVASKQVPCILYIPSDSYYLEEVGWNLGRTAMRLGTGQWARGRYTLRHDVCISLSPTVSTNGSFLFLVHAPS